MIKVCETMPQPTNRREAAVRAKALRARMKHPKRWTIRVWRNLGWHYCLHCGNVTLHTSDNHRGPESYFALVSDRVPENGEYVAGGLAAWSGQKHGFQSPQRAVDYEVECAKRYSRQLWLAAQAACMAKS